MADAAGRRQNPAINRGLTPLGPLFIRPAFLSDTDEPIGADGGAGDFEDLKPCHGVAI